MGKLFLGALQATCVFGCLRYHVVYAKGDSRWSSSTRRRT